MDDFDEDEWNDDFTVEDLAEVDALCSQVEASVVEDNAAGPSGPVVRDRPDPQIAQAKKIISELQSKHDVQVGEISILRHNLDQEKCRNKKNVERIVSENNEKQQKLIKKVQILETQLQFKVQELHAAQEQNRSYSLKQKRNSTSNGPSNNNHHQARSPTRKVIILENDALNRSSFPDRISFESNFQPSPLPNRVQRPSTSSTSSSTSNIPSSASNIPSISTSNTSSSTQTGKRRNRLIISYDDSLESNILIRLTELWSKNCQEQTGCRQSHSLLKWCSSPNHGALDSCLIPFLHCGNGDLTELLNQIKLHLFEKSPTHQKDSYCCNLTSITLFLIIAQQRPADVLEYLNKQKNYSFEHLPKLLISLLQWPQPTLVKTALKLLCFVMKHCEIIKVNWNILGTELTQNISDLLDCSNRDEVLPIICQLLGGLSKSPEFSRIIFHETGSCILTKISSLDHGEFSSALLKLFFRILLNKGMAAPFMKAEIKCDCMEKVPLIMNKLILSDCNTARTKTLSPVIRSAGHVIILALQMQSDYVKQHFDRVVEKRLIQLSKEVKGLHDLSDLDEAVFDIKEDSAALQTESPMELDQPDVSCARST